MAGAKNKYQIDMCRGPLFSKIVVFSVPLMLSGILQLLFNAADLVVIGRYAPHEAMAAVGATASLTQLIVTVFMGLSVGTNVLVANYYGAKNRKNISRTVHTAILLSLAGGAVLAIAGIVLARPMLTLMGTPENVLAKACVYMWIYFAGMPCIMLYNFGSAVLRAVGDTRRPLIFLLLAGLVNVGLNLFFVLVLGMCPTLGTTTSAANGFGMGVATMAVLILSNIVISLIKNFIPDKVRIPAFIVVIASFVTIVQMLMQAFVPALYATLGVFIPLIVVNCIILGRAEAFASKNNAFDSALDGLGIGLGFTLSLTVIGTIRELLGSGAVFGYSLGTADYMPLVFVLAPVGFLVLGYLMVVFNKLAKK